MGPEVGIWALRLRSGPRDWDSGLETRIESGGKGQRKRSQKILLLGKGIRKCEPTIDKGANRKIKSFECYAMSKQHKIYHSLKIDQLKDNSIMLLDLAINI